MQFEYDLGFVKQFFVAAWNNFNSHAPFQAAAALAYYSLFSLAPLVLVIVGVGGIFINDLEVQQALIERISNLVNDDAAEFVESVIVNTSDIQGSVISIIVASALMLIGATTAFAQLHSILNRVWNVPVHQQQALWHFVKGRLLSFAFLIVIGILLAASLLFNTFLASIGDHISERFSFEISIWAELRLITSYGVTTVLIATIYKYLPDANVRWIEALLGAFVASVFFESTKSLVGYYVERANPESAFGAAGSVVVFMLWIYIAALIVLIGAEVSRTYAEIRANY